MKKTNLGKRRLRRCIMAVVIAGAMTAVAADTPIKAPRDLDIVADKNPLSDTVETVPSGTELQKVGQDGSWIKVRTPSGKEGYVSSDDIAQLASLSGASGDTSVKGLNVAGASKGWGPQTTQYANQKGLKYEGADRMIAWGNDVSAKDLKDFAKAGHVGPRKYRDK